MIGRALLYRIDRNFALAVVICALLVLAGGWVTYVAHVAPETTTDERTVAAWTVDGEFYHSAEVQRQTTIHAEGSRLENRSVYFTTLTPELEGVYVVTASDPSAVSVETDVSLEIVARQGDAVLWERSEHLESASTEAGDGPTRVSFALDVLEIREQIAKINDELGVSPRTVEIAVVAETTVDDDGRSTTRRDELALTPSSDVYGVQPRTEGPTSHRTTEEVAVQRDPAPAQSIGGPLTLAAGLGALGALGALRVRDAVPLSPADREALALARERRRFDDWISRGVVPPSDEESVHMSSLTDLVDVAIDSDRRVIESDGRFYVLLGDTRYAFDPDAEITASRFALSADEGGDAFADTVADVTESREPPSDGSGSGEREKRDDEETSDARLDSGTGDFDS